MQFKIKKNFFNIFFIYTGIFLATRSQAVTAKNMNQESLNEILAFTGFHAFEYSHQFMSSLLYNVVLQLEKNTTAEDASDFQILIKKMLQNWLKTYQESGLFYLESELSIRQVSFMLFSFAQLALHFSLDFFSIDITNFIDFLKNHFLKKFKHTDLKTISCTLSSFYHLKIDLPEEFLVHINQKIYSHCMHLEAKDLSSLIWTLGRLQILFSDSTLDFLEKRAEIVLHLLNLKDISRLLWAFAKMGKQLTKNFLLKANGRILALSRNHYLLTHEDISQILWALAQFDSPPSSALLTELENKAYLISDKLNGESIKNILWAFAKFEKKPSQKLLNIILVKTHTIFLEELKSSEIGKIIWAFNKLKIRLGEETLSLFQKYINIFQNKFKIEEIFQFFSIFEYLDLNKSNQIFNILENKLQSQIEQFSPNRICYLLSILEKFQITYSDTFLKDLLTKVEKEIFFFNARNIIQLLFSFRDLNISPSLPLLKAIARQANIICEKYPYETSGILLAFERFDISNIGSLNKDDWFSELKTVYEKEYYKEKTNLLMLLRTPHIDIEKIKKSIQRIIFLGGSLEDPNFIDGKTLLHECVILGQIEVVEFLLTQNININAYDQNGHSALYYATTFMFAEIANLLIIKGCSIKPKKDSDKIFLDYLPASAYKIYFMNNFLKSFFDLKNIEDFKNLLNICINEIFKICFTDITKSNFQDLLYFSACKGYINITKLIFYYVTTPVEKDKILNTLAEKLNGFTALHAAAYYNDVEMVVLLLAKGANAELKNKAGQTPLMLAKKQGHENIVNLLSDNLNLSSNSP